MRQGLPKSDLRIGLTVLNNVRICCTYQTVFWWFIDSLHFSRTYTVSLHFTHWFLHGWKLCFSLPTRELPGRFKFAKQFVINIQHFGSDSTFGLPSSTLVIARLQLTFLIFLCPIELSLSVDQDASLMQELSISENYFPDIGQLAFMRTLHALHYITVIRNFQRCDSTLSV